jgi:serine/threonine-protein kinase HipA
MTYAYNPSGLWTAEHQMSLSGKTNNFEPEDLEAFGKFAGLKVKAIRRIIEEIGEALRHWAVHAEGANVQESLITRASHGFRKSLFSGRLS